MWHLYLDESGDLGFDFQEKNPSKFLTICVLAVSQTNVAKGIGCAIKKTLRRKVNKRKRCAQEIKGASSTLEVKGHFYRQIADEKFGIYAMTIEKCKVYDRLTKNAHAKSRLYNYIARKVLDQIPFEHAIGPVELIVDKSKGGREIRDFNQYVMMSLESRINPTCKVEIYHRESRVDHALNAADLFCWGIFRRHERNDWEWYNVYQSKIRTDDLGF